MLRLMRDHASSWIIKFLLGAIVIVFVFWGVGSWRTQKANRVAMVNGEPITLDQYRDAYHNLVEQLRQRFGSNLNEEMLKMFQVEKQALDSLINQKLMVQEAKKLNFRVPDRELIETIERMPSFQKAGVFDGDMYRKILNIHRMSPEAFEVAQREFILIDKLRSFITDAVKVSDLEALEWYNWHNASVNLDFVLFEPERYSNLTASEEEIKNYYDGHKLSYKTQRLRKAHYLRFNPETYKPQIHLSEEDLQDYFNTNPNEFKTPKTVEARHILIRVDPEASPEEVEKARKKAHEIFEMAKGGQDFAGLAKKYSEDPAKENGGYLGTFKREDMVKPFADKAFSMNAGDIGEPVRTRFGWHIIKVEKVNPASSLSFQEAEAKIRIDLTNDRAKNLAYDDAEAAYESSFNVENLADMAGVRDYTVMTTELFPISGPAKGIKNRAEFAAEAFKLQVMEISEIKEFEDGYYILQVIEEIPEKVQELESVMANVKADLLKEKQKEKARQDAQQFISALQKNSSSMAELSKTHNLKLLTTGFFQRDQLIPEIGYEPIVSKAVFQIKNAGDVLENAIEGKKGYYVIQLRDRKAPDPEAFENEKAKIRDTLRQQKQSKTFDAWLSEIKKKSEISIDKDFIQ